MSYSGNAKSVDKTLKKKGVTATLSRDVDTGDNFDPVEGEDTTVATESQSVTVILFPASGGKKEGLDKIFSSQGDTTTKSTHFAYMSPFKVDGTALDFEPDSGQSILIAGETWFLNGSTQLKPDGSTVIYYEIALKG